MSYILLCVCQSFLFSLIFGWFCVRIQCAAYAVVCLLTQYAGVSLEFVGDATDVVYLKVVNKCFGGNLHSAHTHTHTYTHTHTPVSYTHLTLPTKLSV